MVFGRLVEEILLTQSLQGLHEIGRPGQGLEPLGELLPIPLGNPRDQRFFAVKVNVERPGTNRRRTADILHGRAVEAGVCNAALGSIQNVLAARLLCRRFEFRHGFSLL